MGHGDYKYENNGFAKAVNDGTNAIWNGMGGMSVFTSWKMDGGFQLADFNFHATLRKPRPFLLFILNLKLHRLQRDTRSTIVAGPCDPTVW